MADKKGKLAEKDPKDPKESKNPLDNIENVMEEGLKAAEDQEKKELEDKKQAEEDAKSTVEVDLDEEKDKTKQEVKDEITKEVVEPLKQQIDTLIERTTPKEEKSEIKKELEDLQKQYEKEGKEFTMGDAFEYISNKSTEKAKAELKAEQEKEAEAAKEKEEADKKAQAETEEANFKYWQSQLQDMETRGMLPKMEKPEKGDKGFDARVRLYGYMQGTWKSEAPLTNMFEVYSKFYKEDEDKRGSQPPGADAPVNMGGQGGDKGPSDDQIKYSEIHSPGGDLERTLAKIMMDGSKS